MKKTRIEKVETFRIDGWCLVRIGCEDGTQGVGEAGVHGWPDPTAAMIEAMKPYLIGKDPSLIDHHGQMLYRSSHFMSAVITGAISAVDIALWDIKGKRLDAPVYELMGGKTRDRIRCYVRVEGRTLDELVTDARAKKAAGFTAILFSPFSPTFYLHKSLEELLVDIVSRVAAVRDAIGSDVDLSTDIHWKLSPAESIELARRLEPFNLFFYEDPMMPDSPALMGDLQARCRIPIATGERFTTIFEFQELLEHKGCAYIRPDLCLCMGLTGSKKAAALAESHHVKVIPHNPLSPVCTAACVQLDACIPNFCVQEYKGEADSPKRELVKRPLELDGGYLIVPDLPGIGIELNDEELAGLPARQVIPNLTLGFDGSIQDR